MATMTANSGRKPRNKRLPERLLRVQERRLAHRVARRVEHHDQLHEFRRLQVDDDQRQPAPAAVDRLADPGDKHRDEQHRADENSYGASALPGA